MRNLGGPQGATDADPATDERANRTIEPMTERGDETLSVELSLEIRDSVRSLEELEAATGLRARSGSFSKGDTRAGLEAVETVLKAFPDDSRGGALGQQLDELLGRLGLAEQAGWKAEEWTSEAWISIAVYSPAVAVSTTVPRHEIARIADHDANLEINFYATD